ncbi:unnamed protein product [Amoebophrya sp. A120]|nr:unnamed protein product [Amoebophrya sp. A120]|eukprot:GSA120T00002553001.1
MRSPLRRVCFVELVVLCFAESDTERRLQNHFAWTEPVAQYEEHAVPAFHRVTPEKLAELLANGMPFVLHGFAPDESCFAATPGTQCEKQLAKLGVPALPADATETALPRTRLERRSAEHCFATAAVASGGPIGVRLQHVDGATWHWKTHLRPGDLLVYPPSLAGREWTSESSTAGNEAEDDASTIRLRRLPLLAPLPSGLLRELGTAGTKGVACKQLRRDLAVLGVQFPLLPSGEEAFEQAWKLVAEQLDTNGNGELEREEVETYFREATQRAGAQPYFEDLLLFHDRDGDGILSVSEVVGTLANFSVEQYQARRPASTAT